MTVLYYRTLGGVIVRSVRHRGLRRLIEDDNPQFLRNDLVDRVRKILTALIVDKDIAGFVADTPTGRMERIGIWPLANHVQ
ncbi:MAG: hypothetical protein OXC19_03295 [Bryobacterales bacterium]|nr:hypothetical protein [Bryobacterales bacterium]